LLDRWFAHAEALALFALVPVVGLVAVLAARARRRALARWGGPLALPALPDARWPVRFLRRAAVGGGVLLLILGIAGPQWGAATDPPTAPGRDLVVVLDLSRSMLAQDVVGRSAPNRLGRAIDGLRDLLTHVRQRGGHRIGLVVFAARPQVLCPLTPDYDHFRDTLDRLDPDDPLLEIGPAEGSASGTRIGAGLRRAADLLGVEYRGYQEILLLSDGDDPARDGEWRDGVRAAREKGVPVHTVGIGDPDRASPIPAAEGSVLTYQGHAVGTRLEEQPLEAIAGQTGGTYTAARTKALPLGELFRTTVEPRGGRAGEDRVSTPRQHASWFFGGALALLGLGAGRRGRRRKSFAPDRFAAPREAAA
jgi:Ca-activated chloride channel family protein